MKYLKRITHYPEIAAKGASGSATLAAIAVFMFLSSVSCTQSSRNGEKESEAGIQPILLENYRPHSIYNIPVTSVNKAKYAIIDMHSHDYAESLDNIAEWAKTMDNVGIEKTIILTIAHGAKFDSLVNVYSKYGSKFEMWCGIDYTAYKDPDFAQKAIAELVRCHEMGAKGVGELGDKGKGLYYSRPPAFGMHPDDPRMDPVFEKCGELGMPVNIHVADPIWMYEPMDSTNDGMMNAIKWRLDNQPGIAGHQEMIDILARTVAKHPNTTFVACHVANCCYDLEKAGSLLDSYPNLYMDISARFAELCATPRAARRFFVKYQDRLLYGTDLGRDEDMYQLTFRLLETEDEHIYAPRFEYHWSLSALDLPDTILEKIYRLNALKVLK